MKFLKWLSILIFFVVLVLAIYIIYYCNRYGVPALFVDILEKVDEFAHEIFSKRLK